MFFVILKKKKKEKRVRSKNKGPSSGHQSIPQDGWTHSGSTRRAVSILVQKVVAVFGAHWRSVIDVLKVTVFVLVVFGFR